MELSGTDLIRFQDLCIMAESLALIMRRSGKNSLTFLTNIRFCSICIANDQVEAEVRSNVTGESGCLWSFKSSTWDDFLQQIESCIMLEAGIEAL